MLASTNRRGYTATMISVVIPTLNAEPGLADTLTALVPAAVAGLVRQVVVVDGGSTDRTLVIAEDAGADILNTEQGRGQQLRSGAEAARFPWLLFLHADTILADHWVREAAKFIDQVESGRRPASAAAFRFALDDSGPKPRLLEAGVAFRCAFLRLPYGDQGLLIPRDLYAAIGGFRPLPLMEDVDIIRRLGRKRITMLQTPAITSASRYRRDGYCKRILRNATCLTLYYFRVPLPLISRLYDSGSRRSGNGGQTA